MDFWRISWLLVVLVVRLQWGRCDSDLAVTLVAVTSDPAADKPEWRKTYCGVYDSNWADPSIMSHPRHYSFAQVSSEPSGCHGNLPSPLSDDSLVLREGKCSYYQQALRAQLANASLLVVVYNDSDLSNLVDEMNRFESNDSALPSITMDVVFVEKDDGNAILSHINTTSGAYITTYRTPLATFDPSIVLIFAIAIFTVFLGSFIANTPWEFLRYGLLVRKGESYGKQPPKEAKKQTGGAQVTMAVTSLFAMVLFFVAFICAFLLLLYFFYYPMVYVVIAIYCIGTLVGLYNLLSPFVALIPLLNNFRLPPNKLSLLRYRPDPKFFITLFLAAAVVAWWVVERHSVYAWILQALLGFAFLTYLIGRLMFLRAWIVAILMICLLFYDIFMVFITPFFTNDHSSVMEKVATGGQSSGDGGTFEQLPIVFLVPKFIVSDLETTCADYIGYYPWSLLGYGDVGIPGLFVAISLQFDYQHRPKSRFRMYYLTCAIAYVVGLVITVGALLLMRTAQPALLYLVPTTLGSIIILSLIRREFVLFFTGKSRSQWRQESRRRSDNSEEKAGQEEKESGSETETDLDKKEDDSLMTPDQRP